jgi:hypothetical protein
MVVRENNGKEEGDVDMILGGFNVGSDEKEKSEERRKKKETNIYRTTNIPVKH